MMSITNANSTFGLFIGDKIKSLTFSQKSNCMNNVIVVLTITIKPRYKQHCASHALMDGGLPKRKQLLVNNKN